MTKSNRFRDMLLYLQDPHHVARFQQICGVRGAFSRSSSTGASREEDRTHLHNNGSCNYVASESEANSALNDGREGENAKPTWKVRQRIVPSTTTPAKNGTILATGGGETVGPSIDGGSSASTQDGSEEFVTEFPGLNESDEMANEHLTLLRSNTVKPLRKNSLTGDVGHEFLIENKFLYYLFTFGTELGNEFFYITFFPFLTWNVDAFVGRRLIMVWVWVMYLGQCTKDIIGWSRPASPPVVKVEMFYNSEYSMPSTHAMSGTAIPLSLFFLTYGRWEYPFPLGVGVVVVWSLLVCISRIYMGMHSILDVMVGVLYSILILLVFLPAMDTVDHFNLTCSSAPLIIVSLYLGLGLYSFTLDTWSTSRGDTAQILGTGAGVALASHVNTRLGLLPDPTPDQLPFCMAPVGVCLVGLVLLRLVLGVLVLMATRALMKALTIPAACWLFGVPAGNVWDARQHMEVELPYRYIVYLTVGFNVLCFVPLLFVHMQLS